MESIVVNFIVIKLLPPPGARHRSCVSSESPNAKVAFAFLLYCTSREGCCLFDWPVTRLGWSFLDCRCLGDWDGGGILPPDPPYGTLFSLWSTLKPLGVAVAFLVVNIFPDLLLSLPFLLFPLFFVAFGLRRLVSHRPY
jgi:hypothetical protein